MKERETHLVDYFLVLRRRSWVLLSTFILVAVVAAIGAYRKPEPIPKYQAITTLIVRPDMPALVNIRGAQPFYQQYFDESVDQRTQLQILKSRVILERLVDELQLIDENSSQHEEFIIEKIRRAINVVQVSGTYLVQIIATDDTPETAIKIANTMAEVYIEYNLQTKLSSARKTLAWLNEQIVDLRSKVQDAYAALSKYMNEQKLLSLEMAPEVQARKLAELNDAYAKARQERIEAETRLAALRKIQQQDRNSRTAFIATFDDSMLEKLRTEIMDTELELANLRQSYKEKHPKIQQVQIKVQALHENMERAIDTLFKKLETNVSVLRAQENTLAESVAKFKQEVVEMNKKAIEYSALKSEVSSTEELYNLLFQQLKETTITGDLERNNIRILERARAAINITEPLNRLQIIGFGIIAGILLGISLAFLFEYFDKTIKTPEDVERYLDLPVLGTIPKIDKSYGKSYYYKRKSSLPSEREHYALEGGK